ncbi:MAG: hypothetical protein NTY41_09875 [Proteobacteria bacterium]|nr:hypothetical protein [Pseudomonadota bacterium]
MLKAAVAIVFAISGSLVHAEKVDYYECTRPDGVMEYSIFPCEEGQEQRHIVGKAAPRRAAPKKLRQPIPAVSQSGQRRDAEIKVTNDYHLAAYKCVGRSGDILYTDARDYLAFETYRCKQITPSLACAEARELKTKDPLAMVSSKLACP